MSWFFSKHKRVDKDGIVLGIDGGGTKTQAVLAAPDGQVLKEVYGGPTNPASVGLDQAVITLGVLVADVLKNHPSPAVTVLGLAGIDTPEDERQFFLATQQLRQRYSLSNFSITNDGVIALANGSQAENALILIAGTGSICLGRTATKEWRAGGMDYLLSDEGSGYWLGLEILKGVVRSADGRAKPTIFSELVKKHFNIREIEDLKTAVYSPLLSKTQIADVARLWDAGLTQHDALAIELLDRVEKELTDLVRAVVHALDLGEKTFDLVLAGSIAKQQQVEPRLRDCLSREFKQISILVPTTPPVFGAVTLARKKLQNQTKTH